MPPSPDAKLYDQFAAPERVTLWLQAMARGDEAEAGRLRASCPRKAYTQEDAAFGDRVEMAFDILAVVCIDLRCMWAKVETLDWAAGQVAELATVQNVTADLAFLDGSRCARGLPQTDFFSERPGESDGPRTDEDEDEDDDDDEEAVGPRPGDFADRMAAVERRAGRASAGTMFVLSQASLAVAKQLTDVWAAFDRFCRTRLGVDGKTLLRAWPSPSTATSSACSNGAHSWSQTRRRWKSTWR